MDGQVVLRCMMRHTGLGKITRLGDRETWIKPLCFQGGRQKSAVERRALSLFTLALAITLFLLLHRPILHLIHLFLSLGVPSLYLSISLCCTLALVLSFSCSLSISVLSLIALSLSRSLFPPIFLSVSPPPSLPPSRCAVGGGGDQA